MTGEDYEARKDEFRPDWPGYKSDHLQGSDAERRAIFDDEGPYEAGFNTGVQCARDAVAGLPGTGTTVPGEGKVLGRADALAAIDSLRGESND